jgi:hypothetical protein
VLELARSLLANSFGGVVVTYFRISEPCEFIRLLLTPTVLFSGGMPKRGRLGLSSICLGEPRSAIIVKMISGQAMISSEA